MSELNKNAPLIALLAAAVFGLSTPLAKFLFGDMSPWALASLLYLGSGLGLGNTAPATKAAASPRLIYMVPLWKVRWTVSARR